LNTGNVTDAMSILTEATGKMRQLGGQNLKAFSYMMEKTVGAETMNLMASAASKGFGEIQKDIRSVDATMASGKGFAVAESQLKAMSNTYRDQEEYIKSLKERFEMMTSKAIAPAAKAYMDFKIKALSSLTEVDKAGKFVDQSWSSNIIRGLKKFEQGGILPFAQQMGFGTDTVMKMTAAMDALGPMVKGSTDQIFFFTGTLASLVTVFPGLGASLKGAIASVWNFGKSLLFAAANGVKSLIVGMYEMITTTKLSTIATNIATIAQKAFALGIQGVGLAIKIAMGPVGWIILALGTLTAAGIYAYNNFKPFKDFIDQFVQSWVDFGKAIWNWNPEALWASIKKGVKFWFEWMTPIGYITKGIQGLKTLFPDVFGKMEAFMQPIIDLFKSFADSVSRIYDKVEGFTKGTVGKVWNKVTGIFGGEKEAQPQTVATAAPKEGTKPGATATVTKVIAEAAPEAKTAVPTKGTPKSMGQPETAPAALAPKPGPTTALEKTKAEAQAIGNQDIKSLATVILAVGQEVIQAIMELKQGTSVQLKGDANKFFKASNTAASNRMVSAGITG
jgi:hypothetical protein